MKKFLIAVLALIFVSSCKPEETLDPVGYPTDGLTLEAKSNALLILGYEFGNNGVLAYDIFRKLVEYEHKNRLNHLSFIANVNSPLYNPIVDSMLVYFQNPNPPSAPYLILNSDRLFLPTSLPDDLELAISEKPLASVAHVVSQDDTSYVIDCKVKFFEDSLVQPNAVLIETYMTADIQASNFSSQNVNLQFMTANKLVKNKDSTSYWDRELYSLDSSKVLIRPDDKIINQHLFLENSNRKNIYGTPLSSYWPFGGDFHEGDILGTEDTPIRHHINKLEKGEPDFNRKVQFVTVVWILNPMTSMYEYVNSYSSDKQF